MPTIEIVLTDPVGLHARPAARFVRLAATFEAAITVRNGDRVADAASLLQVLQLEASQGTRLVVEAEGSDADQALAALAGLLEGADA